MYHSVQKDINASGAIVKRHLALFSEAHAYYWPIMPQFCLLSVNTKVCTFSAQKIKTKTIYTTFRRCSNMNCCFNTAAFLVFNKLMAPQAVQENAIRSPAAVGLLGWKLLRRKRNSSWMLITVFALYLLVLSNKKDKRKGNCDVWTYKNEKQRRTKMEAWCAVTHRIYYNNEFIITTRWVCRLNRKHTRHCYYMMWHPSF